MPFFLRFALALLIVIEAPECYLPNMFDLICNEKNFIVVNKHPGVDFHRNDEYSFLDEIRKQLNLDEIYPVHRLDKMTSGIILFGKSSKAASEISRLFQDREMEKYYLAISDKKPKRKQGLIKGDMEKSRRGAWMLARSMSNPAITQFFSYSIGGGKRLFVLKPHSGKTHQLRVAMKSVGSPIVGDVLYGDREQALLADRGYLHAYYIAFELSGEQFEFFCPPTVGELFLSDDFSRVLEEIGNPSNLNWPKI